MSGRPTGRRTNNSGAGNVYRRGGGLNLGGSVGNGGGYSGRPGTGPASSDSPDQRSYGGSGGRTPGRRFYFGGSGRGKKLGCLGTLLENNYYLGETMTVNGEPELSNVTIGGNANAAYKIIDIYNQGYWTPVM